MGPTRVDALNAARKIVSDCLQQSSTHAAGGSAPASFGTLSPKPPRVAVDRIIAGTPVVRGAHPLKLQRRRTRTLRPDWIAAATLLILLCGVLVMCFMSMH